MKRRDLLLLTFLLSQTAPVWAMDPPGDRPERTTISATRSTLDPRDKVHVLQQSLISAQRKIEQYLVDLPTGKTVLLLGATRAGKSTLVNLLAGRPLEADSRGRLDTKDPVKGSEIGHESTSKTTFPSFCQGPDHMVLCDYPGYGDTEGAGKDLIQALIRNKLFSGEFTILVAVEEKELESSVAGFLNVMHHITQEIPVTELKGSLALVITKQGWGWNADPHQRLKEILGTTQKNLNEDVRTLLLHLTDEKNIHTLVSYFPFQKTPGEYQSEGVKTKILESIRCLKPMINPTVQLQLPPESMLLINDLAKNLNDEIKTSIDKLGHKVVELSTMQTNTYASSGHLQELETNLGAVRKALSLLENVSAENMLDFTHSLDHFFDQENIIKEYVRTLKFLKTLKNDMSYSNGAWARTLQLTLDNMHELIDRLANKLCQKVTDSLEEINNSIRCKALPDPGNEERNIDVLQNTLGLINDVVARLQPDSLENIIHFATPLKTFITQSNPNPIENHMGVLAFLKTLKKIDYPLGMWTGPCNISISVLQKTIESEKTIIALNQRLEEERRREEEAARQAEEAARREEVIMASLETQRKTQDLLKQQLEQQQAKAAELEKQQKAQAAELEKQQAEAIEKERKHHADLETARQTQEHLQRMERELAHEQQERERLKKEFEDYQTIILVKTQQAEAAEAERQRQAAEAAAAQQAEEAERQHLLNLPNGTVITAAQYSLLPAGRRKAVTTTTYGRSGTAGSRGRRTQVSVTTYYTVKPRR